MQFPGGRRFAFTILDDTDDSTLENVEPVYALLRACGMRTTKTVWPLDCPEGSRHYFAADTLQRPDYLAFVRELVDDGFELAFHGATMESSPRERTERALGFLEREFGAVPRLHANHGSNRENLYWGARRFGSGPLRAAVRALRRRSDAYGGDVPGSPWFWGDLCREHFDYVRNFTFRGLDVLAADPETPYRLEATPFVAHWFSTADAADGVIFKHRVTRRAIDRLESAGGACILSTHLGKKFAQGGRVDPEIESLLRYVADRPGWFVPVSTLLDHLRAQGRGRLLDARGLLRLELRFLADPVVSRLTTPSGTYP